MADTEPAIINRKIATLAPTWRSYRGVSMLFENPGATHGRRLEDMTSAGIPEQRMYDDLAVLVDAARPARLRATYGFCPLPRTTYHVTVCDGPNEEDLARVDGPAAAEVRRVLNRLPHGLSSLRGALAFADPAALSHAVEHHAVTFAAEALVIWGTVLAAQLVPADPVSTQAVEQITAARQRVAEALHSGLGLAVKPWRPHVSLGYFANIDSAKQARDELAQWNQWLTTAAPAAITFAAAGLYGFTDMVSFLRVPEGSWGRIS